MFVWFQNIFIYPDQIGLFSKHPITVSRLAGWYRRVPVIGFSEGAQQLPPFMLVPVTIPVPVVDECVRRGVDRRVV